MANGTIPLGGGLKRSVFYDVGTLAVAVVVQDHERQWEIEWCNFREGRLLTDPVSCVFELYL